MKQLRVLISCPDRIGDVVLSTLLPKSIKQKYPNSFVALLLRNYTKDIYINNPNVDEIIIATQKQNALIKLEEKNLYKNNCRQASDKLNWENEVKELLSILS